MFSGRTQAISSALGLNPAKRDGGETARGLQLDQIADPHEIGDEAIDRTMIEILRRADLRDAAVLHANNPVSQRQGFLLIVRDHNCQNAKPLLQLADFRAQFDAHLGIQRRQRLVKQKQLRLDRHRRAPARPVAAARPTIAKGSDRTNAEVG